MNGELIAVLDGRETGRIARDRRGRLSFTYNEEWRNSEIAYPLTEKQIHQKKLAGAPRKDVETLRRETDRMMQLVQSLRGERSCFKILAKSKEF